MNETTKAKSVTLYFADVAEFMLFFEKSNFNNYRKTSYTGTHRLICCIRQAENEIPLSVEDITTQISSESDESNALG